MRTSSLAALTSGAALLCCVVAAGAAEPIAVGTRTCLFLDDRFIAEQAGLKLTWNQGKPNAEPAIAVTQPWEKWPHMFGSALYDPKTKLYKLWYQDNPIWTERGGVFYAESSDARVWKKPILDLVEVK